VKEGQVSVIIEETRDAIRIRKEEKIEELDMSYMHQEWRKSQRKMQRRKMEIKHQPI